LEVVVKLLVYSIIYGLIFINWIDLIPKAYGYGYHAWLILMYFMPFIVMVIIRGFENWEVAISLGLLSSLMNDLFYAPVGMLLGWVKGVDLAEWYKFQLGFKGWEIGWYADFGVFRVPVYSWLMGLTIYLRIVAVTLLMWRWLRRWEVHVELKS